MIYYPHCLINILCLACPWNVYFIYECYSSSGREFHRRESTHDSEHYHSHTSLLQAISYRSHSPSLQPYRFHRECTLFLVRSDLLHMKPWLHMTLYIPIQRYRVQTMPAHCAISTLCTDQVAQHTCCFDRTLTKGEGCYCLLPCKWCHWLIRGSVHCDDIIL